MKSLLNWGIFVAVLLGVWQLAGPIQLGGPASYVIVDGRSMEPTYHDGDLVVARVQEEYAAGDVIVYNAPIDASFDTKFEVIHRIVEPVAGGFVTQGDNMPRPDGWIAPDEAIHGAAVFHLPKGGQLVAFLRQPAAIIGLLAGMVAFEYLKRSEKGRTEEASEQPEQVR
jgi:signal peptidase I